jgi:dGTPase
LSWETLDGIIKHNGPVLNQNYDYNLSKEFSFNLSLNPSLEGQVASLCDDIAYIAHDFDDALRSKAISINQIQEFDPLYKYSSYEFKKFNDEDIFRNNLTRFLINYLILDIFEQTKLNITDSNLIYPDEVVMHKDFLVSFSNKSKLLVAELKNFLYVNFYNSEIVRRGKNEAQAIVKFLISFLTKDHSTLPKNWQSKIINQDIKKRVIIDYICGMTDQFAINFYEKHA